MLHLDVETSFCINESKSFKNLKKINYPQNHQIKTKPIKILVDELIDKYW